MGYRELIKKVQQKSGFSDAESKMAIDNLTLAIAERVDEGERQDFASQLPSELQNIALSVDPLSADRQLNIVLEFMEREGIEEDRAKKQIFSAWEALKSFISAGEINHIKSQLPNESASLLY